MMKLPIYLDYMATTPVDPRVTVAMQRYLEPTGVFGNPGSPHLYGQEASNAITNAAQQVAKLINGDPKGIIWTSGATEANNLAIKGAATFYQRQGKHIITCQTEHKAVLDVCKFLELNGFTVTYLRPENDGLIDLHKLEQALQPDTTLVSIMHVNNEIGVIQDIAAIGKLLRSRGILLHVDAAQSAGKIPIDLQVMPIDLLSLSAHKVYGPKGIGALYIRQNPRLHLTPQLHGGSQQNSLRPGTMATHQIVGMGEAFAIAQNEMMTENKRLLTLREHFWEQLKTLNNVSVNGSITHRIAGNLNVTFGDIAGAKLISSLSEVAVSAAAACIKELLEPSHVLTSIGLTRELALSTIRFSFGRFTTAEEIDYAARHVGDITKKLRGK